MQKCSIKTKSKLGDQLARMRYQDYLASTTKSAKPAKPSKPSKPSRPSRPWKASKLSHAAVIRLPVGSIRIHTRVQLSQRFRGRLDDVGHGGAAYERCGTQIRSGRGETLPLQRLRGASVLCRLWCRVVGATVARNPGSMSRPRIQTTDPQRSSSSQ